MNNYMYKITRCLALGMLFIFLSAICASCFASAALSEEKPPLLYLTQNSCVKVFDYNQKSPTSSFGGTSMLGDVRDYKITAKPGFEPMAFRVYNLNTSKDGTGDFVDLDIKVNNITTFPGYSPKLESFRFHFRGRYFSSYEDYYRKPGSNFSMWLDTHYIYANIEFTILKAGTHESYETNIYVTLADFDITPSYTGKYSSVDGDHSWHYVSRMRPSPLIPCYGCEYVKGIGKTSVSPTMAGRSSLASGVDGTPYVHSPIPAKGTKSYFNWLLGANVFPLVGNVPTNSGPESCGTLISDSNILQFQYGGTSCGINFNFAQPLKVEYYVDGEESPAFVDNNHITGARYEISTEVDKLSRKSACLGVSEWYLDPGYTKKYVAQDLTKDIKLYGRNELSVKYASTSRSGTRDTRFVFYENEDLTKRVSPLNLYPQMKKYYYGDDLNPNDTTKLPYAEVYYSKFGVTRSLMVQGVYANYSATRQYPDRWKLKRSTIVYIDWTSHIGDRIVSGW